jgi:tRNA A37 threonylcarbamoyladenosine dehydratase
MTGAAFSCQPVAARRSSAHVIGMADKEKTREERLAAALRENLRKRKAQSRASGETAPREKDEGK